MISKEKWMIFKPLQKLPNNVGDFGKLIVATGFEWSPKVQKIAQSGHTAIDPPNAGIKYFWHRKMHTFSFQIVAFYSSENRTSWHDQFASLIEVGR